jgi:hypothetical protein
MAPIALALEDKQKHCRPVPRRPQIDCASRYWRRCDTLESARPHALLRREQLQHVTKL